MKTAIITGASRGIGREVAIQLAKENYTIAAMARNANELESLKTEIEKNGGTCLPFAIDITNEQDVNLAINKLSERNQTIDILINNAGIGAFKPADELSSNEWDSVMNVNVKGTYLLTKAVVPIMKKQMSGQIIAIASDVSKRTFETGSLYCASKYAQDAFMSALRKEIRKYNIKVSVIYPGLVDTYFHANGQGAEEHREWLKPSDISDAIVYMANLPKYVVIDELMIHPMSQDY